MIENMAQNDPQWFNQALRQAPWRSRTQTTSLALAAVIMVAVIGALYLAQASRTAEAGRRLQVLDARRQVLEQQNAQMRAEIASLRSVPRLVAEAAQMGFHEVQPDEIEYVKISGSRYSAPVATPLPTAEEIVPAYHETLGSWLAEQFAALREGLLQFMQINFSPRKD
jgi:cell division protein FtsB